MLVIILTTIIVLITLWYCPKFNNSIEHYAPQAKGAKPGQPPTKGAKPGQPPAKGPAKGGTPPAKGAQPSLTPDTVISIPLGVLVQFLSKVGAGDIGG